MTATLQKIAVALGVESSSRMNYKSIIRRKKLKKHFMNEELTIKAS